LGEREFNRVTVIYESDPRFHCLPNRFVYVKRVHEPDGSAAKRDSVRGKVSTVGLAATEDKSPAMARNFRAGV